MQKEQTLALFLLAGIRVDGYDELPNNYWPRVPAYLQAREASPWWLAHTELGTIKIGWRKRVISIEWDRTEYRCIVTEDDVTKSEAMVHAYSYADAVKYLATWKSYATRQQLGAQS